MLQRKKAETGTSGSKAPMEKAPFESSGCVMAHMERKSAFIVLVERRVYKYRSDDDGFYELRDVDVEAAGIYFSEQHAYATAIRQQIAEMIHHGCTPRCCLSRLRDMATNPQLPSMEARFNAIMSTIDDLSLLEFFKDSIIVRCSVKKSSLFFPQATAFLQQGAVHDAGEAAKGEMQEKEEDDEELRRHILTGLSLQIGVKSVFEDIDGVNFVSENEDQSADD